MSPTGIIDVSKRRDPRVYPVLGKVTAAANERGKIAVADAARPDQVVAMTGMWRQGRDARPAAGDDCVLLMSDNVEPVVIWWGRLGSTMPPVPLMPPPQKGDTGPAGPVGAVGPVGPQGLVGPTGPAGAVGPQGPAGPAGGKGDAGTVGATGPAGAVGATGAAGTPGAIGLPGPKGDTGATGPKGDTGATGPAGSSGSLAMDPPSPQAVTINAAFQVSTARNSVFVAFPTNGSVASVTLDVQTSPSSTGTWTTQQRVTLALLASASMPPVMVPAGHWVRVYTTATVTLASLTGLKVLL